MDTQTYPERVTLCEDGQYRWSYILSREQSRFYYRHMLKICSIIAAVITVIALGAIVVSLIDKAPKKEVEDLFDLAVSDQIN